MNSGSCLAPELGWLPAKDEMFGGVGEDVVRLTLLPFRAVLPDILFKAPVLY